MILFELFYTFLIIGLFTFGGGYSMIALIQSAVVDHHAWLTTQEFADILAISQITPGPVGINAATYAGYSAVIAEGYPTVVAVAGAVVASLPHPAPDAHPHRRPLAPQTQRPGSLRHHLQRPPPHRHRPHRRCRPVARTHGVLSHPNRHRHHLQSSTVHFQRDHLRRRLLPLPQEEGLPHPPHPPLRPGGVLDLLIWRNRILCVSLQFENNLTVIIKQRNK